MVLAERSGRWAPRSEARLAGCRGPRHSRLERETGFEPATSTLARSHSTTELFPPLPTPECTGTPTAGQPGRRCGYAAPSLDRHLTMTNIQQISATELKAMMESGEPPELVDVRTEHERAIAAIEGSKLLDDGVHEYLLSLDRDTPVVFQCHHGIRSQAAAEYFARTGFRNLYNLAGGIDAWSVQVDPSVPRY